LPSNPRPWPLSQREDYSIFKTSKGSEKLEKPQNPKADLPANAVFTSLNYGTPQYRWTVGYQLTVNMQ
jgi:hypothetical protein